MPTPALAFLTTDMRCDAGVMISASHNPYQDNGIKFFGHDGFKLPNELERETPYIEYSLDFTRRAFGLDDTERRGYAYDADAPVDWAEATTQFAGLPIWGTDPLLTTYEQQQARFSYYGFDRVAIDRYPSATGVTPVAISVRQVDPSGIQDGNWQNLHLRELYVAGMGAVASVANSRTQDARPEMLLAGIPPEAAPTSPGVRGLELTRPEIFFETAWY